ncbi:phosphatase PAP2 family protein [Vibrio sp. EA2]|uniref:phosphatase PAP2 family protein n=1 Tax=Vibrio sp. EA2 TaxID=3079860 RepID=UPI00294A7324|nr:phosphatase PAP2 family protein [Vibrio sp. EA2]MDV6251379.1 phosphatase PAP2 family protein [Vibrio sp. EA2]
MEQDKSCNLNVSWQERFQVFTNNLWKDIIKDKFIYLYCITSTVIIYISAVYLSLPIKYSLTTYFDIFYVAIYISILSWLVYCYFNLLIRREKKPAKIMLIKLKNIIFPINRIFSLFLLLISLSISFSNYTFLKSVIPIIHPYGVDKVIIEIDRWLHFGVDPWVITHYIFSTPWSTLYLNAAYNAWFFLMWGVLFFFLIYNKKELLRKQFLITFLLTWLINGGVFAIIFSSVGPCYLELLTGNDIFSPLMQRLNEQNVYLQSVGSLPLWALNTQSNLWQDYITQSNGIGSGISAMPSMHVSIAFLMSLALYQFRKSLGIFAYVFAIIIQIGSVHLGWHYAIDGYFSIISTVALWKLIGHILVKNNKKYYENLE